MVVYSPSGCSDLALQTVKANIKDIETRVRKKRNIKPAFLCVIRYKDLAYCHISERNVQGVFSPHIDDVKTNPAVILQSSLGEPSLARKTPKHQFRPEAKP